MKQSHLFSKTQKLAPKDEVAKNAELLIRAGFVHKQMAGVYAFLPLGLKVLNKISDIIREEMVAIGGVELQMTALQEKAIWEKTNRWSDDVVDNWFKTELKNETELGLGFTHEEPLTALMKEYVNSYRDLPFSVFQIQTKFRNESRAKSGLMRGREFLMKDLYSFSKDDAEHQAFYERAKQAYVNIFKRVGLGDRTYVTFAAGGTFSKYSHEFQTVTDAGEDVVYVDEKKGIAVNKEVYTDEVLADLGLNKADLVEKKAVEVGNIFSLGTKFSDAFELTYLDEKGEKKQVVMGSYGIGPSRLMGVIAELLSDEKGIIWPVAVAPFPLHLVVLGSKDGSVEKEAEALYQELNAAHIETLFDDRDLRPGEKFADSDLIGIPYRAVVSEKNLAQGVIELKNRKTGEVTLVKKDEFITQIKSLIKA